MSKPLDDVVRLLRAPVELFGGVLKDPVGTSTRLAGRTAVEAHAVAMVLRAGLVGPEPPWRVAEIAKSVLDRGALAAASSVLAIRHGDKVAILDERGPVTFTELDRRAEALATAWHRRGVVAGSGVGVLCRNHRGFLEVLLACTKLGARALLLNTDFAGPQAADVCAREGVDLIVADEEFEAVVAAVDAPLGHYVAWTDDLAAAGPFHLDAIAAADERDELPKPDADFRLVILTSGTTGTPKGAGRGSPSSIGGLGALLSKVPFRSGGATYVAPPMFHALGLASTVLALALGSTVVTRRRFVPAEIWRQLEEQPCTALIVVPVMLSRMLAADEEADRHPQLPNLRVVLVSGAQLDATLAQRSLARFGPVVHNLYGSTEVAYATIATPDDLAVAPGCAGRPPFGVNVRILDDSGNELPVGETGRIFVANEDQFGGYTGGGGKEIVDGSMSTGDVGHFDADGRLWVDGRDDEMIVSGGENVFPREVEELLAAHEDVVEAAVVGVADADWGQRLRAYVVTRPDSTLDATAVQDLVRANLARYKVPRDVVFLDELPRNPSGKVLKRVLVEQQEG